MQKYQVHEIGDLAEIDHGYAFEGDYFVDNPTGLVVVTPGNFQIGGGFKKDSPKWYSEDGPIPNGYTLSPGDLIVTMTDLSQSADTLGYAARVPDDEHTYLHNQRIGLVRTGGEVFDGYLHYAMRTRQYRQQVVASSSGSTVHHSSPSRILECEIPVPPLPVQRRIADILGALDDKIELNRRMNETLEEMAQTLYYHLFDGSVDGDGVRLDELVNIKPRMPVPDDDEVLTYVGMADVEPNRMSVTDYGRKEYTSGRRFINGDTLMARITPSLENGKTAFVDFLDEGEMAFGSTEFTVMRAEDGTSPYFVYCCARDRDFREYAISTMTGSSGRQRVQENLLGKYAFDGYGQEDMAAFHEKATPLFKLIRSNTSENRTLAETRDYLLPKLISGEIEVETAEEAVESVA